MVERQAIAKILAPIRKKQRADREKQRRAQIGKFGRRKADQEAD